MEGQCRHLRGSARELGQRAGILWGSGRRVESSAAVGAHRNRATRWKQVEPSLPTDSSARSPEIGGAGEEPPAAHDGERELPAARCGVGDLRRRVVEAGPSPRRAVDAVLTRWHGVEADTSRRRGVEAETSRR